MLALAIRSGAKAHAGEPPAPWLYRDKISAGRSAGWAPGTHQ